MSGITGAIYFKNQPIASYNNGKVTLLRDNDIKIYGFIGLSLPFPVNRVLHDDKLSDLVVYYEKTNGKVFSSDSRFTELYLKYVCAINPETLKSYQSKNHYSFKANYTETD